MCPILDFPQYSCPGVEWECKYYSVSGTKSGPPDKEACPVTTQHSSPVSTEATSCLIATRQLTRYRSWKIVNELHVDGRISNASKTLTAGNPKYTRIWVNQSLVAAAWDHRGGTWFTEADQWSTTGRQQTIRSWALLGSAVLSWRVEGFMGPPTRISARHLEVLRGFSYSELLACWRGLLSESLSVTLILKNCLKLLSSIRAIHGSNLGRYTDYYEDFCAFPQSI